ncbi:MAG: glycosyltransferase [Lachnospiraceae bacterium]|nr:glycosyltransferase [Lachnospiraceae bacterium]
MNENNRPNVSIITVCRNPGRNIVKTFESVLAQDYSDFEYIIQDCGSNDGTSELIDKYASRLKTRGIRISVFYENDPDIYSGMNRAVTHAEGTWINFLNAGSCFYASNVLSSVFNKSNYPNAAILYGDAVECEYGHYHMFRKSFASIESRMPFSLQAAFINRELLSRYPFKTDYRIGADYDWLLSMHGKGFFFRDVNTIICILMKNDISSLKLYDAYMDALRIRNSHGITGPTVTELIVKKREMKLKQFVMDHFPVFLRKLIRQVQLILRKQNADLTIPSWARSK